MANHRGGRQQQSNEQQQRPTVCLIGCGAAGMCFLHALATRCKAQETEQGRGKDGNNIVFPYVVCMEQANECGGCWRIHGSEENGNHKSDHSQGCTSKASSNGSISTTTDANRSCWYDDLWTNVGKESLEFYDYSFKTYFQGKEAPTFLPKSVMMDYFMKRTTSVDPNLFQRTTISSNNETTCGHELRYNTIVTQVIYNEKTSTFEVASISKAVAESTISTELTSANIESFDYCVVATGQRQKPRIPNGILEVLKTGATKIFDRIDEKDDTKRQEKRNGELNHTKPFKGDILHSMSLSNEFWNLGGVQDKNIVVIGDSDSALEVTLTALKHGANKVDLLSRSGFGDCVFIDSWPGAEEQHEDSNETKKHVSASSTTKIIPKVQVHVAMPYGVIDDGRTLKCVCVHWDQDRQRYEVVEDEDTCILRNVDAVIFCTGFSQHVDFLNDELQMDWNEADDHMAINNNGKESSTQKGRRHNKTVPTWSVPKDFKMSHNAFTEELGDVEPSPTLTCSGNHPIGLYRTVSNSNPKLMFIQDSSSEFPLLTLEAKAWLCLAYITGEAVVPSKSERHALMKEQMIQEMNVAYLRWNMDRNYYKAIDELGENHWSDNYLDARTITLQKEFLGYFARLLARDFKEAKYPVSFGDMDQLNDLGKKFVEVGMYTQLMAHTIDRTQPDAKWTTYHDVDPNKDSKFTIQSIFTGQRAVKLPRPWMEMMPTDDLLLPAEQIKRTVKFVAKH